MKTRLLPLALVSLATLAGCSDASGGKVAEVEDVTEIRDALAGTDYECSKWDETDGLGLCTQRGNGTVNFTVTDDPELYAAVLLDQDYPETSQVIVGENWAGRCATAREATCEVMADQLGARVVS